MSVVRFARSVVIMLAPQLKETLLVPVMFVHSQFAGLAMNTSAKMAINLALNAKLDTNDIKVLIYVFHDFSI